MIDFFRRRPRGVLAVLVGLVLVLVLGAGCSRGGGSPVAAPSPSTPSTPVGDVPPAASPGPVPSPGALARFYEQRPQWQACGGEFQCTRVTVPRDYTAPEGATLELAVVRLPATGRERVASLVVNPGGPGASGVAYARVATQVVTEPILRRFDLVGFDPRGVAGSAPIDCLADPQLDAFIAGDGSPDDPQEERELVTQSREFGQGCARRSPELLPVVSTEDAARDLDVLRSALGDDRLHYLGKSYGTYLGGAYAELFPDRVGRLVLDGALDPRVPEQDVALTQAKGFQTALTAFVDECLEFPDCPLPGPRREALDQVRELLERADRRPLPSTSGRPVTESLALLGVVGSLYDDVSGWPLLREALAEALDGQGDTLLAIADSYTQRRADGRYASNQTEANIAINCLDSADREASPEELRVKEERFARAAPIFGPYLAWGEATCAEWPVAPRPAPRHFRAAGAAPILVVGTLRDPATPHEWAVGLAEQLESGVLLTWDGDGHTAYQRGSVCVDDVVDAYLLRGAVPRDGRRCA